MTTPPKRRWFSFSLRTMFVLVTLTAIPLGWLTWQVQLVRERKAVLAEIKLESPDYPRVITLEEIELRDAYIKERGRMDEYARVSRFRRLLGDASFLDLQIPSTLSPRLIERLEESASAQPSGD